MSKLAGKSVLVSGGAGFIGSHLAERLLKENVDRLVVVDNLFLGKLSNLDHIAHDPRMTFVGGDAGDPNFMEHMMRNNEIDIVYNMAVIPLLASFEYPRFSYEENVRITGNICELARKEMFDTLVHCSSSEAYGTAKYIPMEEEHPMNPTTPYAASKASSDLFILAYCKSFGVDASIVRPFNTYGPRQNDASYAAVIPLTINRILDGIRPVIYGDGLQTRDLTYVTDIVEGLVEAYTHSESRGQITNVGSGREITIKQLVSETCRILDFKGGIDYQPPRTADVRRHLGSIEKAKKILGYSPKVTLEEGLRMTIAWYKEKRRTTIKETSRLNSPGRTGRRRIGAEAK